MAEFVQNSLNAGATQVEIERRRICKLSTLVVRDNGEGVLPEMDRKATLRHIAGNIGEPLTFLVRFGTICGDHPGMLTPFWSDPDQISRIDHLSRNRLPTQAKR